MRRLKYSLPLFAAYLNKIDAKDPQKARAFELGVIFKSMKTILVLLSLSLPLSVHASGIGDEIIDLFGNVMHRKLNVIQTTLLKGLYPFFSQAYARSY